MSEGPAAKRPPHWAFAAAAGFALLALPIAARINDKDAEATMKPKRRPAAESAGDELVAVPG